MLTRGPGRAAGPGTERPQDAAVRTRGLDWWRTRAATGTPAERARWLEELDEDLQNTRARLAVAGPFDPSKVKFRTQLQGEVADLEAWQALLAEPGRADPSAAAAAPGR